MPWASQSPPSTLSVKHSTRPRCRAGAAGPHVSSTCRGWGVCVWFASSVIAPATRAHAGAAPGDGVRDGSPDGRKDSIAGCVRTRTHSVCHCGLSSRGARAGHPVKFSETPPSMRRPPPLLGEHTDEVLGELLGYDRAKLAELRAGKHIA